MGAAVKVVGPKRDVDILLDRDGIGKGRSDNGTGLATTYWLRVKQ